MALFDKGVRLAHACLIMFVRELNGLGLLFLIIRRQLIDKEKNVLRMITSIFRKHCSKTPFTADNERFSINLTAS